MLNGLASIIPALTAGFLFVVIHYPTRLLSAAAEGQRLFFMCAAFGLMLSGAAYLVLGLIRPVLHVDVLPIGLQSVAWHQLLTFALGIVLAGIANFVIFCYYTVFVDSETKSYASTPWEWIVSEYVRRFGNPLRRMLVESLDSVAGERLILVTLVSRKVYCGAIKRTPVPTMGEDYIELIPMFSATRNKESLKFEHQIDYPVFHLWRIRQRIALLQRVKEISSLDSNASLEPALLDRELSELEEVHASVLETAPRGYAEKFDINLWSKVIPVREVESISFFDEEGNDKWFQGAVESASQAG